MKKQFTFLLLAIFGFAVTSYGQTDSTPKSGITWSGFVKTDYMFDTRQTVNAREGHFNIIPSAEVLNGDGDDLNANPNFNILSIQSRLKGTISGPDFFGMKTSGAIEAAFFGNTNSTTGELRLRHAFLKLSNDKYEILMGQYWNPMFVTSVFPGTYSFNTGVPFQPFARNPQIRFSTKGDFRVTAALYTERDFKTRDASVSAAGLPQMHVQLQYGSKSSTLVGAGVNLKSSRVVLLEDNITSTSFIGFFRTNFSGITYKLEAVYGQNMTDVLQIGGFGVNADGDYVNNTTMSVWTELSGNISESMEWGLFGGYTQNQGYGDNVFAIANGFLGDLHSAYRVSPRIGWKSGKTKIGIELAYTVAQYSNGVEAEDGTINITDIDPVGNLRLLTTAIYKF